MIGFIGLSLPTNAMAVSFTRTFGTGESATVNAMEATIGAGSCEIEFRSASDLPRWKVASGWGTGKVTPRMEFAGHEHIARKSGCQVYFADPYSSWQRGTNENTNGLLRQYFPKGSDFSKLIVEAVNRVVAQINLRPRKRLGWKDTV